MPKDSININELTEKDLLKMQLADGGLSKRIKYLREIAHCNREEAASFARVRYSTYKAWENGKARPAETRARWLVDELQARGINCTMSWLLTGKGELPIRIQVSWDNKTITSENVTMCQEAAITDEEHKMREEVEFFCRRYPNSIGFVIPDNSMLPTYSSGDIVAGIQCQNKDIAKLIGKDCIIELKNGDRILRNLQEGQQIGRYALLSANLSANSKKRILYDVEITFAAPISWHRKKIAK